jgi:hypothetical protein
MKKLLLTITTVIMFAVNSMASSVLAGGSIPLINSVMGIGTMTLDFASDGSDVQIAYVVVNNNSQEFIVTIEATNDGNFINEALSLLPAFALEPTVYTVPMDDISIGDISQGTLGDEQTANAPVLLVEGAGNSGDMTADIITAGTPYTWDYLQQTATENYVLGVFASWGASKKLAGLYAETLTLSIEAILS